MTYHNKLGVQRDVDGLTAFSEFTGFGGDLQGIIKVPGVVGRFAANHDPYVLAVSRANYPWLEHFEGDIQRHDITKFVPCALFAGSPACPRWTGANGEECDFDQSNQEFIPGLENGPDEATVRSRLLMDEIHRYLNAMWISGQPVLAGVVENVVECRKWDQWRRWIGEFHKLGYKTRVIAFNSMHAEPVRALRAPQSRDRLYVAYWLEALGRDPDWDKWLRPSAWCPSCEQIVRAVQVFRRLGADMGRYRAQYDYRCPNHACRGQIVEPETLGAYAAIDWALASTRIGERKEPLAPKTMARIGAGALKFGVPHLAPAGGTWRDKPSPVSEPMPTRTTRESDGVTTGGPLLVPVEGRPGKEARPVAEPARTQTCRNETGLALAPFIATLRGGGSAKTPHRVTDPATTVSASGNHHGLVTPPEMLVPYYGNGSARTVDQPVGALTTKDRYALAESASEVRIDRAAVAAQVARIDEIDAKIQATPKAKRAAVKAALEPEARDAGLRLADAGLAGLDFRMLEPHEIRRAMAFDDTYTVPFGSKRQVVRGFGNAVTAPVSEVLFSALVEAITGDPLERSL